LKNLSFAIFEVKNRIKSKISGETKMNKKFMLLLFFLASSTAPDLSCQITIRKATGSEKVKLKDNLFISRDKNGGLKRTSSDGTVFIKKITNNKELLVRVINGKEEIVRDFSKERVSDPSLRSKNVSLLYMVPANRNKLYCIIKVHRGDKPKKMPDGTYSVTLKLQISKYVEMWDGKSWRRIGGDFGATNREKIDLSASGEVYLFVDDVFSGDKLLRWDKSKWQEITSPLKEQGKKIVSFSVDASDKIWFITENRIKKQKKWWWPFVPKKDIFLWNKKTLEDKKCKGHWVDVSTSPDGKVFVLDKNGRLFELVDLPSQGFFSKIICGAKSLFR